MNVATPLVLLALCCGGATAQRTVASLNEGWKFQEDGHAGGGKPQDCESLEKTFPVDASGKQCTGLKQATGVHDLAACAAACCAESACTVYQFCPGGDAGCGVESCWIGQLGGSGGPGACKKAKGWEGRGRNGGGSGPSPAPPAGGKCADPRCDPKTDDSAWRVVNVPHDFVVEHNFSQTFSTYSEQVAGEVAVGDGLGTTDPKVHGYLPFGVAWYRKHFTPPASLSGAATMYIDFDGIQTKSEIYLNGVFLGEWDYGYTGSRYFLNSTTLKLGEENLLAVRVDCTEPDGWWYDGGGIYRNVWFTAVESPGPVIAPWGLYVGGSKPTGDITWDADGNPSGDSELMPQVELWNNASSTAEFTLAVTVKDKSGATVASSSGKGTLPGGGGSVNWSPDKSMAMPAAKLWHVWTNSTNKPALYTATAELTVGGKVVDSVTETFGVRKTEWTNATGFSLNGKPFKILGNANHQDFPAVGVAVPDHLQWYRVQGQKYWGSNGWRTAHNPPTPALLDAMDELGYVSWDENHRNGQLDQVPWLIKRDRNHPCVVIWSICNEVLCQTDKGAQGSQAAAKDAATMSELMHKLDPLGNRPVSANQNGWEGPDTPLDVQGFDYNTQNYDPWHGKNPNLPIISSETSSAVSDRGEYGPGNEGWKGNATTGHVTGYDVNYPGWGQSAEMAWGGINEKGGEGILTRPFISGGWTWTGWDYRGEPTPYAWPNVNSHFGIMDMCGFWKDRTHWYASWFPTVNEPATKDVHLHAFPHWNWGEGDAIDIWSFSNAASVALEVNGKSVPCSGGPDAVADASGGCAMPKYGHVEWKAVEFAKGSYTVTAYDEAGAVAGTKTVKTTGAPAKLKAEISRGVGETLYAGCGDMALVEVSVLDADGNLCPDPDNTDNNDITFAVSGTDTAWVEGSGNGDPSCLVNNKSPTRPAYHGLALGVIGSGNATGTITVTTSSPGLTSATVEVTVKAQDPTAEDFSDKWCHQEPKW
jgi:beta-galactosidase